MPQTVTFFLADFQSGGTEWFALRLARGLARRGVKPIFLVVRPEGDLLPLIDKDIEIVSLGGTGYSFGKVLRTLPALIRFLKTRKPDVFLGGLTILNIVAALAVIIARTKTRLIVIEHMRLHQTVHTLWAQIKRTIKILFVRLSYVWADEIIAVSKAAHDDLINMAKIAPTKPIIIANPIIPDDLETLKQDAPPHPWLVNKHGHPVIVAIGRLLDNKDFAMLLHAFASVRKDSNARLIIFGEGEERLHLEALINALKLTDHATLGGQINNVFSALSAANLFVLPSRSEAFGNVVVEALACGCPVVSTDSGGPREILENGKYGKLVPPRNPSLLAKAISNALSSPPQNKDARIKRGKSYDVESAVQKYLALFKKPQE